MGYSLPEASSKRASKKIEGKQPDPNVSRRYNRNMPLEVVFGPTSMEASVFGICM
jgi:hypothetical protein